MRQYVFIHGLGQTSSSWDKVVSYMGKPIQAACPELFIIAEGKEMTYDNLYQAFSVYCDQIKQPLNLCGLSLGGVLALNYAIDHPGRVTSLVLIGTPYKMPKVLLKFQKMIFRLMPGSAFEKMGLPKSDILKLTDSMVSIDFSESLGSLTIPVLSVCGEKDGANRSAAKTMAEKIRGAQFVEVENAAHEVNVEKPRELTAVLRKFYKA